MTITIMQFGGGQGSFAGDSCFIKAGDWLCLVDLGFIKTRQNSEAINKFLSVSKFSSKPDLNVVLTHFHKDHIADESSWTKLNKAGAKLHYFDSTLDVQKEVIKKFDTSIKINAWKQYEGKTSTPSENTSSGNAGQGLDYRFTIIPPDASYKQNIVDENDESMGVLLEVAYENKRTFTFLSLGDMTTKSAEDSLIDCLSTYGVQNIDLIKLSHHGSENNLLPMLNKVIKKSHTTLLTSGYTMTDTSKLTKMLQNTMPKACIFLFENEECARMMQSYAALKKVMTALPPGGVSFARDYVVTCGAFGQVSAKAKNWSDEI